MVLPLFHHSTDTARYLSSKDMALYVGLAFSMQLSDLWAPFSPFRRVKTTGKPLRNQSCSTVPLLPTKTGCFARSSIDSFGIHYLELSLLSREGVMGRQQVRASKIDSRHGQGARRAGDPTDANFSNKNSLQQATP